MPKRLCVDSFPQKSPPPITRLFRNCLLVVILLIVLAPSGHTQTIEDGIMLSKGTMCAGFLYSRDEWNHYWEGGLNRVNGNLGTVTTQAVDYAANYGVFNRLNVIGSVPYVWTHASQGVLHGQSGFQDISLAAKYRLLEFPFKDDSKVKVFAVASGSIPLTDYSPDFQPLSIGLASKTIAPRATATFEGFGWLYANGSAAYVFRGNVKLDRNYYYTGDQLYLSNEVAMPNQFDYVVSAGYRRHDLMLVGNYAEQQTRGGGDIRRQDAPFVSNRMNFSKAGASAVVPVPLRWARGLQYWFTYSNTFDGRNVGRSQTVTTGLMYLVRFSKNGGMQ
jgi:hypothetical protein